MAAPFFPSSANDNSIILPEEFLGESVPDTCGTAGDKNCVFRNFHGYRSFEFWI